MKDLTVVMLGHKSLAGKDTVFSFAEGLGFKRVAFADSLKYQCMDIFNLTHDQVFGSGKDIMDERYPNNVDQEFIEDNTGSVVNAYELPTPTYIANPDYKPFLTPRRILQLYGQYCRSLYKDVWASYIFTNTIPKIQAEGHDKIMITDFRFKNEATVAQRWAEETGNNLLIYKVNRPGVFAKTAAGDESENDLNDFEGWTGEILNDSTLDSLEQTTVSLFSSI